MNVLQRTWHSILLCLIAASPTSAGYTESAASSAYDSGLTNGTVPSTAQLSPWAVVNSANATAFIGSSATNGGTGTINTSGRAFGINAAGINSNGLLSQVRTYAATSFAQGVMQSGDTFGVFVDAGVGNDFQVISLANKSPTNSYAIGPNLVAFNGTSDYFLSSTGSDWFTNWFDTGIPVTQPVKFSLTMNADGSFGASVNSLTTSLTFAHSLAAFSANSFYAQLDASSSTPDAQNALMWNGMTMDGTMPALDAVPEPGALAFVSLSLVALLRRR